MDRVSAALNRRTGTREHFLYVRHEDLDRYLSFNPHNLSEQFMRHLQFGEANTLIQGLKTEPVRSDSPFHRLLFRSPAWQEASPVAQMVKRLPTIRETWVRSLGWDDPLEKEMAMHSSTLAWKSPWTEEPGGLQSMGLQRVGHDQGISLHFSMTKWSAFWCQRHQSKPGANCKTFPDPLDGEYKEMKKQTNRIWMRRL